MLDALFKAAQCKIEGHMVTLVLLRIILVVLLVAANAFFVAAEFAMVSVRDTRIQQLIEQRRIGARTVLRIQQHLDEFLPAVQFGVTLASLGLGIVGEPTFARMLQSLFAGLPIPAVYIHVISLIIGFIRHPARTNSLASQSSSSR